MFQPDDFVSVRLPISSQWFLAWVIERHETFYIVETAFPVADQIRWRIGLSQIRKPSRIERPPPKPSPSLQKELNKFKKSINSNKGRNNE
jgi:hypothetical protein